MNNNIIIEIKNLLQKIDFMEIKLNEMNKENKKKILFQMKFQLKILLFQIKFQMKFQMMKI